MNEKFTAEESETKPKLKMVPVQDLIPNINLQDFGKEQKIDTGQFKTASNDYSNIFYGFFIEPIEHPPRPNGAIEKETLEKAEKILHRLKGQIVVDLGASDWPWIYKTANMFEARAYIGVDITPFGRYFKSKVEREVSDIRIPASYVQEDMLTFLKRLPDNSVSIFACGIDCYILNDNLDYIENLEKEIARVLSFNGVCVRKGQDLAADPVGKDINQVLDSWDGTAMFIKKKTKE
jgi:hypothetical protein